MQENSSYDTGFYMITASFMKELNLTETKERRDLRKSCSKKSHKAITKAPVGGVMFNHVDKVNFQFKYFLMT